MSSAAPRVYLDANVFVTAFENVGAHSDHAWWIIDAVENGKIIGATSEITLAEILVKPLALGTSALAAGYQEMITTAPNFEVLPVRRDVLVEAAHIRARRTSIRLPDAVHIATARLLSCAFFVSNDHGLSLPDEMSLLRVGPFTLDDIVGKHA